MDTEGSLLVRVGRVGVDTRVTTVIIDAGTSGLATFGLAYMNPCQIHFATKASICHALSDGFETISTDPSPGARRLRPGREVDPRRRQRGGMKPAPFEHLAAAAVGDAPSVPWPPRTRQLTAGGLNLMPCRNLQLTSCVVAHQAGPGPTTIPLQNPREVTDTRSASMVYVAPPGTAPGGRRKSRRARPRNPHHGFD